VIQKNAIYKGDASGGLKWKPHTIGGMFPRLVVAGLAGSYALPSAYAKNIPPPMHRTSLFYVEEKKRRKKEVEC